MPKSKQRPSDLALAIYKILRRALKARHGGCTTYGELAAELRASGHLSMTPRNRRMHMALGELTMACQALRLPVLPAIVWRRDRSCPGDQYYPLAHPAARTAEAQRSAWKREHDRVVAASDRYPVTV
jgi:hypothetical protein